MSAGPQITWDRAAPPVRWDQPKPQAPETRLGKFKASLGTGVGEAALDIYQPLRHPYDTAAGLVKTIGGTQPLAEEAKTRLAQPGLVNKLKGAGMAVASDFPLLGPAIVNAAKETAEDPVAGLTHAALNLATLRLLPELSKAAGETPVGRVIREAAMAPPDEAALRALRVAPTSKAAAPTLRAVETARPFLKGVKTQAELQERLPIEKKAVWAPYQKAIEEIGDRPVAGPDGVTTVRALEEERLQLSAINRGLRSRDPAAIQLAEQKKLSQAQLLERERQVKAALDPELEKAGVDPRVIRRVHGSLSQIQARVSGRLGAMEKAPVGLGKMVKGVRVGAGVGEGGEIRGHGAFFTAPLVNVGAGLRDILAGRGLWEASPADIGVREGFRTAGERPSLTLPAKTQRLLPPAARTLVTPEETRYAGATEPRLVREINLAQRPENRGLQLGPSRLGQKLLTEGQRVIARPAGEPFGPSGGRLVEAERIPARGKGGRFVRAYTSNPRALKRP